MQVQETVSEGLKREFKVVVSAADIEGKVTGKLNDLAPTVRLPGFRPGKAPLAILKQRFGKSVMGEVLEQTVNESSRQTLEDRGLRAAMQPQIEITAFEEGKDLEYSLSVELMPEITTIDYATLKLEREVASAPEDEIDAMITRLSEGHKRSEPIKGKRATKSGDVAVIDFKGSVDGELFEGGSAEGHQLELGAGQFIPGFEDQLIGVKAGEEKTVSVSFPEDYNVPHLAGKAAIFETKVTEIRAPVPVEINDEFAKLFGMDDLAALRDAVRGQIEQEYGQASRAKLKRTLLDKLEEGQDFDLPPGMVDQEYQGICRALKQNEAGPEGHNHDHDHDHDHNHDHDHDHDHGAAVDEGLSAADKAEYRTIAERRVRLGVLLQEIGRFNNIEVTEEETRSALMQEAQRYPGQEQQILQLYQNNPQAMAGITAPLYENKVVDFILELADVTERTVTPEDLMRDPEEGAAADSAKPKSAKGEKGKKAKKPASSKPAAKSAKPAKKPAAKKPAAKKPAAKKTAT